MFSVKSTLAPLIALCISSSYSGALERVEERAFGKMPDGTTVRSFRICNTNGISAAIISYGAILTELNVPDKKRAWTNVVLSTNSLKAYAEGFRGPAAVIGRVANRIAGARFELDGVQYKLSANNGTNHIHGVFGKSVWKGKALPPEKDRAAVQFTYFSKDGEDGLPGNVTVKVTYTLTDKQELRLDYEAVTDKPTPINLTSHAYFNLAGSGDALKHELWLGASRYTPVDESMIPTGEIASVGGTPLDFRTPTALGARIEQLKPKPGGYDHNYVLDKPGLDSVAARVREPVSGRIMEVRTTQPGVQLYSANHLKHAALCLETQHYPDSVNHPNFPSTILRPGETFRSTTIFKFTH